MLQILLLLAIACCFGFAFGLAYKENGWSALRGVMLGISLVPSYLSVVTYIVFATTSFLTPNAWIYLSLPLVLAVAAAVWLARIHTSAAASTATGSIPVATQLMTSAQHWTVYAAVSAATLSLLPIGVAIGIQVSRVQIDHDLSIYLLEAAHLSSTMQTGLPNLFAWQAYTNPHVTHPHSLSYTLYLAWGFLLNPAPGFGQDAVPKMLIGVNHIATACAVLGLLARPGKWMWAWFGLVVVLLHYGWDYQFRAFSRDTFYVGPMIALLALLSDSRPGAPDSALKTLIIVGAGLAIWGVLSGHTLGIVYVAGLVAAVGIQGLAGYGLRVFAIIPLWLAGISLIGVTATTLAKYFGDGAGDIGFAYPFYDDPFLKNAAVGPRNFFEDPQIFRLLTSLAAAWKFHWVLLAAIAGGACVVTAKLFHGYTHGSLERLWITLTTTVAAILAFVWFAPVRLDGIALASAFSANLRYGFGLGILAFALAAVSGQLLVSHFAQSAHWLHAAAKKKVGLAAFIAICVVAFANGLWHIRRVSQAEARLSEVEHTYCQRLRDIGARQIFVDNDGLIYRCPGRVKYLFTEDGAKLIGAYKNGNIGTALDAQDVDAILLKRSIATWWRGTHLYRFLQANWTEIAGKEEIKVFVRPELAKQ